MTSDVALVGAGPVGLVLTNLLARRGISVDIFEKQDKPYSLPRAIHFDGEAMRCFQAAGLAEAILPHTHVGKGMLFQDADGNTLIDWSRDQEIGPMGCLTSRRCFHYCLCCPGKSITWSEQRPHCITPSVKKSRLCHMHI